MQTVSNPVPVTLESQTAAVTSAAHAAEEQTGAIRNADGGTFTLTYARPVQNRRTLSANQRPPFALKRTPIPSFSANRRAAI